MARSHTPHTTARAGAHALVGTAKPSTTPGATRRIGPHRQHTPPRSSRAKRCDATASAGSASARRLRNSNRVATRSGSGLAKTNGVRIQSRSRRARNASTCGAERRCLLRREQETQMEATVRYADRCNRDLCQHASWGSTQVPRNVLRSPRTITGHQGCSTLANWIRHLHAAAIDADAPPGAMTQATCPGLAWRHDRLLGQYAGERHQEPFGASSPIERICLSRSA